MALAEEVEQTEKLVGDLGKALASEAATVLPMADLGAGGEEAAEAAAEAGEAASLPRLPGEPPIQVPEGWTGRVSDNGQGTIWEDPGSGASIRVSGPDAAGRYPNGYTRITNSAGNYTDVNGIPGDRPSTHIPNDYGSPITLPK
jgi:hypothetical protein